MIYFRICAAFLVLNSIIQGQSPLNSINGNSTSGMAPEGNPAMLDISSLPQTGFNWTKISESEKEPSSLWSGYYQRQGFWGGIRYLSNQGPFQARTDFAFSGKRFGMFSQGIRFGYLSYGNGYDHLVLDAGVILRPISQFSLGYWGNNLYTGWNEKSEHHWAFSYKPFVASTKGRGDFELGVGFYQSPSRRGAVLFSEIPLIEGFRLHSKWDFYQKGLSLGFVFQATGQMAAGYGWSQQKPSHRIQKQEIGITFREDQRVPFLIPTGNTAELNLNTSIVEGKSTQNWFERKQEVGFLELEEQFNVLENHPYLKSVLIQLGKAKTGWAIAEEIRLKILSLRQRGIRVVVYMDQVTPLNYYMASGANVIALQPQGYFAVTGFASEVNFYRGFFDKLGIEPQFLRHGKYKSFEEPFTRKSFTKDSKENLSGYLQSLWENYLSTISSARKISIDSVRQAFESGQISLAYALKANLIDTLIHADEALKLAGGPRFQRIPNLSKSTYLSSINTLPKIAVVVVSGEMVMGESSRSWFGGATQAGAESVVRQLRQARLDAKVKAVVLRVNSPGGSAQAADRMWREVELLKEAGKPVIASVGHHAASGGYYILCGADRIYAEPNSTVGSIGVLWGKFVIKGVLEKLGINVETIKTAPHADGNSMARLWDSSEVQILQSHMDEFYQEFVAKVAVGRKKSKSEIDSLGQGQIFTGSQALQNGLIDTIGGYWNAIEDCAKRLGLNSRKEYKVEIIMSEDQGIRWNSLGLALGKPLNPAEAIQTEYHRYQHWFEPSLLAMSPELTWLSGERN